MSTSLTVRRPLARAIAAGRLRPLAGGRIGASRPGENGLAGPAAGALPARRPEAKYSRT